MRDEKRSAARRMAGACATGALALAFALNPARAETIGGALIKAYLNNPDINSQRAAVRASDEGVPGANAGYLPVVSATANAGVSSTIIEDGGFGVPSKSTLLPRGYGVTVQENLFNGNKTFNTVRKAESTVFANREQLRYTEQSTLLSALTYYMDVMQNTAVLDLQRSNVDVLKEQLRQTRDRFNVGEVTRTDVAQAEASLADAQATYASAQSTLQSSIASYRQAIGDQPHSLAPVTPVKRVLPSTLTSAIAIAQVEHPAITYSLHSVDAALLNIKISEAPLYPSVNLQASLTKSFDSSTIAGGSKTLNGQILGQLNVPIYDGGATFASIRSAKEQLSQQELTADSQREKVRAAVVASWGANEISGAVVRARKAQVQAAEVALAGVREEAKVGQRTTLDVLNAQQTLVNARVNLVRAQHDQVVNSYTLLSNVGRLSVKNLGLSVAEYDPRVHFNKVKVKQFGVRTPDGR